MDQEKKEADLRLTDFVHVSKVASDLGLNPQTIKRWLKGESVPEVVSGRDRRGWVYIHRDSIKYLIDYRDRVRLGLDKVESR